MRILYSPKNHHSGSLERGHSCPMPLGVERYVSAARRGSAPVPERRLRRRSSAVPQPYLFNGGERKGTAEARRVQGKRSGSTHSNLQSQRDCVLQPRVAICELPWVSPSFARPSPNPCKQGIPSFWHCKIASVSTSSFVCGSQVCNYCLLYTSPSPRD